METRKIAIIGAVSAMACWVTIFGFLYLIQ